MPYLDYEDKKIFYEAYGEGKPILVINGLMMSTLSWYPYLDTLANDNTVILYDLFDQGKSSKLLDGKYTHKIQVEGTRELLKRLNYEKVSICGLSYGAEVAIEFATKYPEAVERLIILNGTASTTPWIKAIGDGWNKMAKDGDGEGYFRVSYPGIFSPSFYNSHLDFMEKREKVLVPLFDKKEFRERMIRLTESSESYDVRKDLYKINCPTLIVSGEEDYLTPLSESKYLCDNIKNSHLVILYKTGHTSIYERPHMFTSLLLGFVNSRDSEYTI